MNASVAPRDPVADGVNVILTVQLADPASDAPQVLAEIAKSEASAPETAMLLMLMAAVPPLLNVTVWAEVVEPTTVAGKDRLPGATVAFAGLPVPDNATVWGLFPAESVNASVAVREPVADGVKVMLTVQLADPARDAPQVLAEMVKSAASVLEMLMLLMLMAAVPPLLNVTV
jgi:hypothetical protein